MIGERGDTFGEWAVLNLMYAALILASQPWQRIVISKRSNTHQEGDGTRTAVLAWIVTPRRGLADRYEAVAIGMRV